jgi:cyclopropane-fatty-acyl-phospholipid synthase
VDWLLDRLFRLVVVSGNLQIITARGAAYAYGDGDGQPVTIRFTSSAWQWAVILDPELRVGEAYMYGGLAVEQGSIAAFLDVMARNISAKPPVPWSRLFAAARRLLRRAFLTNNLRRARANAKHHYDIDERIYRLFLDSDMQYSCAYFEDERYSLEEAQEAKKRHIAAKLNLDEERLSVLDIGSGWGGLGLHLARLHKASVVGINLSDEQLRVSSQRAAVATIPCEFRKCDYREMTGTFDRIVSVGMFEHVGRRDYRTFFDKCHDLLSHDGMMLLHTVGRLHGPADTNAWVWKYIFPGGHAPALSELAPIIEQSGLVLTDVEVLRLHYAETLRHWRTRMLANREEALRVASSGEFKHFIKGEAFVRMWEYYLAGFEASFRNFGLCVFQIQLSKKLQTVPMTRDYMYNLRQPSAVARRSASLRLV